MDRGRASLEGKTVLVIGAGSRGSDWSNGSACSAVYARELATVICVDNIAQRAEETAHIIAGEGGKAIALRADATNEDDVQAAVARAVAETGRLDVIHNNVGLPGADRTPDQGTLEDWNHTLTLNLTTAYLGMRASVPIFRRQGGGAIINTSSLFAVRFVARPTVAYTVAKAGVEALTRSCAAAYGRDNIRVNCIRIGFSETPLALSAINSSALSDAKKEEALEKSRSKVPLRQQHGSPFDVAHAAAFLASDAAAHISGAILNVDGGLECAPI
jgi:hypothetical protein